MVFTTDVLFPDYSETVLSKYSLYCFFFIIIIQPTMQWKVNFLNILQFQSKTSTTAVDVQHLKVKDTV